MTDVRVIVNGDTEEIVPLTDEEIAFRERNRIEAAAEAEALAKAQAEAEAKRSAALAKLEALGLDEDDLKALGL